MTLTRREFLKAALVGAVVAAVRPVLPPVQKVVPKKYYICAKAGNDSYSGLSFVDAWQTLGPACDVVQPGDTIYIGTGTYRPDFVHPGAVLTVEGQMALECKRHLALKGG